MANSGGHRVERRPAPSPTGGAAGAPAPARTTAPRPRAGWAWPRTGSRSTSWCPSRTTTGRRSGRCVSTKPVGRTPAPAAVGAVAQQPGRHQREQAEADEGEAGGEGQRVAPQPVRRRPAAEQHDQHGDRARRSAGSRRRCSRAAGTRATRGTSSGPCSWKSPRRLLEADDPLGVGVGVARCRPRPSRRGSGSASRAVEADHRGDLAPPPQRGPSGSRRGGLSSMAARRRRAVGRRSCRRTSGFARRRRTPGRRPGWPPG